MFKGSPDTPRCIHCSMALKKDQMQKALSLPNETLSMLEHAELVGEEDYLCPHCVAALKTGGIGHCCVCAGCGCSMNTEKTHFVPASCPQRTVIESWLSPHHAHFKFNRVCEACWDAACDELQVTALKNAAKALDKSDETEIYAETLLSNPIREPESIKPVYALKAGLPDHAVPIELMS